MTLFALLNTAEDGLIKSYEVNDLLSDLKPGSEAYIEIMKVADYFVRNLVAAKTTTEHYLLSKFQFSSMIKRSTIVNAI
jgi:hypothetical protein